MVSRSRQRPMPAPAGTPGPAVAYAASVFAAADMPVLSGANAGDPLPLPGDSVTGDYYRLAPGARAMELRLALSSNDLGNAKARVAPGSEVGDPGAMVRVQGRLSLMADDGDLVEVLVLGLDGDGEREILGLPLSPLRERQIYTLIGIDHNSAAFQLVATIAGAFARGTRVAMADGGQVAVENLLPGQTLLTRDHGAQVLRWVGAVQMRAEGVFAPVSVLPGVMGNPAALTVSPHHRLFLYRPDARPVAGVAELLVQARHLVDETRIVRLRGGVVEYFSLVFDQHEVIYAEGVPCESLRVAPATLAQLPSALADPLRRAFPGMEQRVHIGAEVAADLLARLGTEGAARMGRAAP